MKNTTKLKGWSKIIQIIFEQTIRGLIKIEEKKGNYST